MCFLRAYMSMINRDGGTNCGALAASNLHVAVLCTNLRSRMNDTKLNTVSLYYYHSYVVTETAKKKKAIKT